jgi:flagellar assembly protein FliH
MSNLWSPRLRDAAQRADFWPADAATPTAAPVSVEADAFTSGLEQGRRTVEMELAGEREALLQMVQSCAALEPPAAGAMASLMLATVERLVRDIAGNAAVDADLLRERVDALAAHVAGETAPVLVLHPDDLPLIDTQRLDVLVETDGTLTRGTVQARAGDAQFEDGVRPALARLRAQMDAMGIAS